MKLELVAAAFFLGTAMGSSGCSNVREGKREWDIQQRDCSQNSDGVEITTKRLSIGQAGRVAGIVVASTVDGMVFSRPITRIDPEHDDDIKRWKTFKENVKYEIQYGAGRIMDSKRDSITIFQTCRK